jgi:hypothetical protein
MQRRAPNHATLACNGLQSEPERLKNMDMDASASFASKFRLLLKAWSMSRGGMAAQLGVDKSLIGRWASGAVTPSDYNLARITQFVAARHPGFSMVDWDRDLEGFAAIFGVEPVEESSSLTVATAALPGFPPDFFEQTRANTERRGAAYEGFWRTTRPSVIMDGELLHDQGMFRIGASGMLEVRMGGGGLLFEGWMLPVEGDLFFILYDSVGFTPLFLIFKGVPLPKAHMLDGLLMFASLNAGRVPAAVPLVLERIGDLTGDRARDDATCGELLSRDSLATDVPDHIRRHLVRDIGPEATARGGDLFLMASPFGSLSRGATLSGQLRG